MFLAVITLAWFPETGDSGASAFAAMPIPSHPIDDTETPEPKEPTLAAASGDGLAAIDSFKFPGLKCELYAAEPQVGNIVAIHRDYKGNLYVCETYRQGKAIEDNRNHAYWLDDDLQAQTVQDRIDYILKHHPEAKETYTQFDDRIRVLSDTDNDGKADVDKVFANRFNDLEMGSGAGVLSYRGNVYYTCIPDLFMMTDTDGDLVSDERKSLSTGYGVRFAFRGHDSHGLIVGPDGMLYFSIGDRGYDLAPNIRDPASGAVFRCELDGSNLEVVATGLRNPQELAFDQYGDLFTGDNNSDAGDEARWTYVVPGGDSGWRMYFQYLADRGPWNRELIWDDENEEKPAYVIPCIKNISDGPSGLEYYPGTGFSEDFDGRFFLCDFRGTPTNSGVRSFRNKPVGAFYELVDDEQPIWSTLCTDIDFASDGKLYLSDWVFGWNGEDKGRIYTFFDEERVNSAVVKEVESILRDGLADQPIEAISALMAHKDQRVRQESQFELVKRKEIGVLRTIASSGDNVLPRLHALWGVGQLLRSGMAADDQLQKQISTLFDDKNEYVRREAVRLAADYFPQFSAQLEKHCADESAKVRYEAAMGLGKIGTESSADAIVKLLVDNANKDPIVRHGGIMAIRGLAIKEHEKGESTFIDAMASHKSAAVRLATVVALRKQFEFNALNVRDSTYVVRLLAKLVTDSDAGVALDAARAISDLQMDEAMEPLANLILTSGLSDHMIRRAISANNRLGDKDSAIRLATFVAESDYDSDRKNDALRLLGEWADPDPHDPVTNAYRKIDASKRNVADAAGAVSDAFEKMTAGEAEVVGNVVDVAAKLGVKKAAPQILSIVMDEKSKAATRASALSSLEQLEYDGMSDVLNSLDAKADSLPPELAAVYVDVLSRKDPSKAVVMLSKVISSEDESVNIKQKQDAFATLSSMTNPESEASLASAFASLESGSLAAELELDVLKASETRGGSLTEKAATYTKALAAKPVMADRYLWALKGGDHDAGEKVFREKTEVSCVRCHRIDGTGGKVGPDLSGVGKQYDRRGVLESIVDPNLKIADGHGQIIVATDDGLIHTGVVKEENDTQLALMDKDGNVTWLDSDTIEGRKDGKSSMPEGMAEQMTRDELRDLVEFLAQRVTLVEPAGDVHE
jgi:quinoprotein glucose dehydrogenase